MGFVQSASNTAITGTSLTVTFGTNTTAGTCVVAQIGAVQGTTNPTVSNIKLNTSADNWAVAKALNNNSAVDCEIWTDQDNAGGQTAVVTTFTAGTGSGIGYTGNVTEYAGVAATAAVDKTNGQSDTTSGSTWSSLATGALAQAAEVIFASVVAIDTTLTITGPTSPWVNYTQLTTSTHLQALNGYQPVAATTTQTYNGTFSAATVYTSVIVSLKVTSTTIGATAALHGGGTMTLAGSIAATAALHGGGTMTSAAAVKGTAALHGGGTMTPAAAVKGTAALRGGGTMTPVATVRAAGAVALHGGGTMTPSPLIIGTIPAAAALHGGGTMTAVATVKAGGGGVGGVAVLITRRRKHRKSIREYKWES